MPLYWCGPAGGWQGAELLDATKEAAKHGGLEDSFVVGIEVNHGEFVNSVVLNLRQGATGENWDLQLGGMRVGKREYIDLNRGEFVSGIWGASGQFVDSIAIELSSSMSGRVTRTFGPFGGAGGTTAYEYHVPKSRPHFFFVNLPGAWISWLLGRHRPRLGGWLVGGADTAIVGIHGRSGRYVDSIGVIMRRPL
jgi:hypothetical protein